MLLASALTRPLPWPLLQAVSFPDTIIARTIPDRGVLEWTNGILQMLVLLLSVGALVAFIMLLGAMRAGVKQLNTTLDKLADDTRPILANASQVVSEAREVVTVVKQDVARMSEAAVAVSDTILDAAEITAQRVDEVNAVLDVIQDELEETAITAVTALRGARVGASEMLEHLPGRRKRHDSDATR
jgi:hypothetical protein